MKTAERILATALTLFNERGENTVTSVDIAMELDISPGNLYYHFKGKEVIVDALVDLHKTQMMTVLARSHVAALEGDDVFYYLYLLVDKLHLFRFLYRSPADLSEKYPHCHRIRKQIVKALENQLAALLSHLHQMQALSGSVAERTLLVEVMALIMTQSCQYDDLHEQHDEEYHRYHALSLIMTALLPRLQLSEAALSQVQQAIDSHTMATVSAGLQQQIAESG